MHTHTRTIGIKIILVGLLAGSFAIGKVAGSSKCEADPQDHVLPVGMAAKMIDSPYSIILENGFNPTIESKKERVNKFNAMAYANDEYQRYELVELFYRKVEK